MQFKSLFLGAVAASGALGADRLCGFKEPSAEDIAIAQAFAAQEAAANETMSLKVMATTNVNVYFHVIATSQSASGGYIPVSTKIHYRPMFPFHPLPPYLAKISIGMENGPVDGIARDVPVSLGQASG